MVNSNASTERNDQCRNNRCSVDSLSFGNTNQRQERIAKMEQNIPNASNADTASFTILLRLMQSFLVLVAMVRINISVLSIDLIEDRL